MNDLKLVFVGGKKIRPPVSAARRRSTRSPFSEMPAMPPIATAYTVARADFSASSVSSTVVTLFSS